jgi:D-tyrosyl-tRNA(Tyr) deacylase
VRALLQRVDRAAVTVDGSVTGAIDHGLLILVCAMPGDTDTTCLALADKITKLRIFKDESGKMNKSVQDVGGSILIVSQFTLAADTTRGNRPGFSGAANADDGKRLYEVFVNAIRALGIKTATGIFGADMDVDLVNQGPVTIWMDTAQP